MSPAWAPSRSRSAARSPTTVAPRARTGRTTHCPPAVACGRRRRSLRRVVHDPARAAGGEDGHECHAPLLARTTRDDDEVGRRLAGRFRLHLRDDRPRRRLARSQHPDGLERALVARLLAPARDQGRHRQVVREQRARVDRPEAVGVLGQHDRLAGGPEPLDDGRGIDALHGGGGSARVSGRCARVDARRHGERIGRRAGGTGLLVAPASGNDAPEQRHRRAPPPRCVRVPWTRNRRVTHRAYAPVGRAPGGGGGFRGEAAGSSALLGAILVPETTRGGRRRDGPLDHRRVSCRPARSPGRPGSRVHRAACG